MLLATCLMFAAPIAARAQEAGRLAGQPVPELDRAFDRRQGWTGADAAYSVHLTDELTLWLFGDTFLGAVRQGKRVESVMVRNTIGLQSGASPTPHSMAFFHGLDASGKPDSFFRRDGSSNWFWPLQGIRTRKGLFVFLTEIEKTDAADVFGFRQVGVWLAHIPNWRSHPSRWRIAYRPVPHCRIDSLGGTTFGTAVLRRPEELYIYGVAEERCQGALKKSLVLARAPAHDPADFARWRFRGSRGWTADPAAAVPIRDSVASELSVTYDEESERFLLTCSRDGLSPEIWVAAARRPWGPFEPERVVYSCREPARDPTVFCYAAKAHAGLASPGRLVLTYVANSTRFERILEDASLYRPRFVSVRLRPAGP
ncbi:MAG: DUF4185 domain-containing protein [Candidatus Wallbacteria bacterium]|nr:DUF4185 domain-containing protein [Candidatus Wallbacteria bacterium]